MLKPNIKVKADDNIKIDMVSADQMTEEERNSIFNREASVDAIPDLDILTGHVYDILAYLEKPETKKLLKTNESAVKMYLNNKYADSVPLGIITLLMEEDSVVENIERMLNMFEQLRYAKSGKKSLEDVERAVTDDVNQRYMYSKFGSKEKFEEALAKEVMKERSKGSSSVDLKNVGKVSIKN